MRILVLSDIHANLAALEAVLDDAAQVGYDAVWCLGDTVGYGPEPEVCVARMREIASAAVIGNHDWAALGLMDVDEFNPEAQRAVLWTRERMSVAGLAWLGSLPSQPLVTGHFTLTHGSPRDPVWEYVTYATVAAANFDFFDTRFCLVGHTHVPALHFQRSGEPGVNLVSPATGRSLRLEDGWRAILNPGSVGQPRDNDPRAAYAILDTAALTWLPRRVSYPIEVTQAHMRAAGLPERLINRLAYGW
jgi:predicted phosphodiesterase